MKGYKAFNHDMTCRDKQYAENTVFEEPEADICRRGMHFCQNLLECLNYYPFLDNDGNLVTIAEVEALDEVKTDDNRKFCTKKLRVGAKLDLKGIVLAQIDFVREKCVGSPNYAQGDCSKAAAQGNYSNAAAQGYYSKAAAQGGYSNAAAQGNYSNAAAQGNCSNAAAQGNCSKAAAQGNYSKAAAQGYYSKAAAQGGYSNAAAQGGYSNAAAQGNCSKAAAQGNYSNAAAQGYNSKAAAQGDCSKAAAQGNYSKASVEGESSIAAAFGYAARAKASVGSWIVLSEHGDYDGHGYPVIGCVAAQIDGEKLKPNTWYTLKNGVITEVE